MNDKIIDGFIVYVILYECYEPNEQKYVIYLCVYAVALLVLVYGPGPNLDSLYI